VVARLNLLGSRFCRHSKMTCQVLPSSTRLSLSRPSTDDLGSTLNMSTGAALCCLINPNMPQMMPKPTTPATAAIAKSSGVHFGLLPVALIEAVTN